MDIKKNIYIWVTSTTLFESGTILDGLVFDGDLGFGVEYLREFRGELALYSEAGKKTIEADLSTIHVSKKGTFWALNSTQLPTVPFLLSNNLSLNGPVKKSVSLKATKDAEESFIKDDNSQYPVESEGVIGLLDHNSDGDSLTLFSESEEYLNSTTYKLLFSEWELKVGEATCMV